MLKNHSNFLHVAELRTGGNHYLHNHSLGRFVVLSTGWHPFHLHQPDTSQHHFIILLK